MKDGLWYQKCWLIISFLAVFVTKQIATQLQPFRTCSADGSRSFLKCDPDVGCTDFNHRCECNTGGIITPGASYNELNCFCCRRQPGGPVTIGAGGLAGTNVVQPVVTGQGSVIQIPSGVQQVVGGAGFQTGNNPLSSLLSGRCQDGSTRASTCTSDTNCFGDYVCARINIQTPGSCCPSCSKARRDAQLQRQQGRVGVFEPACVNNREYAARQSSSSSGYTWCVTTYGFEIPGTRTSAGSSHSQDCYTARQTVQQQTNSLNNLNQFGGVINQGGLQNSKPGYCPTTSSLNRVVGISNPCTTDYSCPGIEKCCHVSGGRMCINPNRNSFGQTGGSIVSGSGSVVTGSGSGLGSVVTGSGSGRGSLVTGGVSGSCYSKPGQCGTIAIGQTFVGGPCQCDNNCPGSQKCCMTSSGRRCVQTSTNIVSGTGSVTSQCFSVRPGQCPNLNLGTSISLGVRCRCDSDCPFQQKCCYSVNGNRCVNPVNTFGRTTVSQGICTISKNGVCPFSGTSGAVGVVRDQCTCDDQCVGRQKCCQTNSGRQCRDPLLNSGTGNAICQFSRPGICPAVISGSSLSFATRQCQCDSECGNNQKCCNTPQGRRCVYVNTNSFGTGVTKPGFCPVPPFSTPNLRLNRNQCQYDDQCPGSQKCCRMLYGHECVEPNSRQQQQCGVHAEYVQCQNPCPPTCQNPNPSPCPSIRCSPGCQCQGGYIREAASPEAPCVPRSQCNSPEALRAQQCKAADHKTWRTCASGCPVGCNNRDNPPTQCNLDCVKGCYCQQGYIFVDANNWRNSPCVRPDQCDALTGTGGRTINSGGGIIRIGSNQCLGQQFKEFNRCGTACPIGCDNLNNRPRFCTSNCVEGCFCTRGYVFENSRNWRTSRCVPESQCSSILGGGGISTTGGIDASCRGDIRKEYRSCGSACPEGCDNLNLIQSCQQQCVPGCFCKSPYIFENAANWRNSRCVYPTECTSISGHTGTFIGKQ